MELEGLRVAHALPGRVRLKVAKIKGNRALASQAQEKLAKVPGIRQVEAKPDTGSLLIHYDMDHLFSTASLEILSETLGELFPEIEVLTLAAWLASLAENPGAGAGPSIAAGLTGSLQAAKAQLAKLAGGLDLKLLVPLTLIFLGFRRLWTAEKVAFPSWSDYLWFGFASFIMLNRGLVEGSSGTAVE
ncbi:MAG: HMA2 domain-containing protein, partial [Desulfobaccales bacterium]